MDRVGSEVASGVRGAVGALEEIPQSVEQTALASGGLPADPYLERLSDNRAVDSANREIS